MLEIVEEETFKSDIEGLRIDYKRLDDALIGVTFSISRRPDIFPRVPGTSLYAVKTDEYPGVPPLVIWFTFNETTVTLHRAELRDTLDFPF